MKEKKGDKITRGRGKSESLSIHVRYNSGWLNETFSQLDASRCRSRWRRRRRRFCRIPLSFICTYILLYTE